MGNYFCVDKSRGKIVEIFDCETFIFLYDNSNKPVVIKGYGYKVTEDANLKSLNLKINTAINQVNSCFNIKINKIEDGINYGTLCNNNLMCSLNDILLNEKGVIKAV